MVTAKDLKNLIRRLDGLMYRLHGINPSKISALSQGDCVLTRRALEEAKEASADRMVGQLRRAQRPWVKGCEVLNDLVKKIIAIEKEFQAMIQDKLDLIDKRERDLS